MGLARSCAFLGWTISLLLIESLDAFALIRSSVAGTDLDATFALTAETFWQLACSKEFYRTTRQHSRNVRQEVLELSDWTPLEGPTTPIEEEAPPASAGGLTLPSPPRPTPERRLHYQHQQQDQQLLQREARLAYAISSPLGSSNATVVQKHTLEVQDGGAICYSEADCITGFPMVPGDLNVKATYTVTPAEGGDPGSVRICVGVAVGDIGLPKLFSAVKPRVRNIVEKDVKKQARRWLQEMTETSLTGTIN